MAHPCHDGECMSDTEHPCHDPNCPSIKRRSSPTMTVPPTYPEPPAKIKRLTSGSFVTAPEDIPEDEQHYAILEFGKILVPGDERSRQSPGHGYPEHVEQKLNYLFFDSRQAWEQEITRRSTHPTGTQWVPLIVQRPTYKVTVSLDLNVKR